MNATYARILSELEAGERNSIARRLFDLLQKNPGGMTRRQLVPAVFGKSARLDINSDTNDRKIRATIAAMREKCIPIVSTSGEPGYRLDDSHEARITLLAELISRRDRLNEQIKAVSTVWEISAADVDMSEAKQERLL
jgi:hypothetical protein